MNCQQSRALMMDILYDEEVSSEASFEFFGHVDKCHECDLEYRELLETRRLLGTWELESPPGDGTDRIVNFHPRSGVKPSRAVSGAWYWSGMLARAAAVVLMLLGAFSLLRSSGVMYQPTMSVSNEELAALVNDMIVEKQSEDWQLFARALINLKEDLDLQRRQEMRVVFEDLSDLERRYLTISETTGDGELSGR